MSPSLTSVHHVAIFVHALAPCEHFYGEVLGLPIVRRWTNVEGNDTRSVWFGLGHGAFLAVELNPQPQPTNNRRTTCDGWHLLAIGIDKNEREIWREHLQRSGFPCTHETPYTLYCCDPEGNRVGLSHWPEPVTNRNE